MRSIFPAISAGFSRLFGRFPRPLAALAAALVLFAVAEVLYRAGWALKGGQQDNDPGYFSLYVVGESTAAGEPYSPGIKLSSLVAGFFGGKLAGREIRVFDLARQGESVYPQYAALERALRSRRRTSPGVVLVYSGHNDSGTERGGRLFELFREKFLFRSLILSDLSFAAEKMFPRLRVRTLDTYRHYLRRIVELSRANGLEPVLFTVAGNLADMDPGLRPGPGLSQAKIEEILDEGQALESAGRYKEALSYYSDQAAARPLMRAYLAYRRAKCQQSLGEYKAAAESFKEALDFPAEDNFRRATGRQNDLVRDLARTYGTALVDSAEIFRQSSPNGLAGDNLFIDGHHPNIGGYLLLARACAREISGLLHEAPRRDFSGPAEIFREFSYGNQAQADAAAASGSWLFSVAALHARPAQRLKMARARFEEALRLDPGNFPALLGLALTDAAVRNDILSDRRELDWLGNKGLFYGGAYDPPMQTLAEIFSKLLEWGAPSGTVDEIAAAAARRAARAGRPGPAEAGRWAEASAENLALSRNITDAAVEDLGSGRTAAAEAGLLRALEADPLSPEALVTLCSLRARTGRQLEAAAACGLAFCSVYSNPARRKPGRVELAAGAAEQRYRLLLLAGREKEADIFLRSYSLALPQGWPRPPAGRQQASGEYVPPVPPEALCAGLAADAPGKR